MIASDPIQILLIHTATEAATLDTRGAFGFEWTVIAVPGIGAVASRAFGGLSLTKMQLLACRTNVHITLCIIVEVLLAKEGRALGQISDGDIGLDMLSFQRHNIVSGTPRTTLR